MESTNAENASIFQNKERYWDKHHLPTLASQFLTNRPLHAAFAVVVCNLQNDHQAHKWMSSPKPPAAVQPHPAGFCTVQTRRGELCVSETTSAQDTMMGAASQLSPIRHSSALGEGAPGKSPSSTHWLETDKAVPYKGHGAEFISEDF